VIHKENSGLHQQGMSVLNWLGEYLWFVDGVVMKDSLFVLNDLLNCNKKHRFVILVE
jgi:hypothetical protein